MAKFIINAVYHKAFSKELTVYAKNEEEAREKAEEIIGKWDDVVDIDVTDVVEE